jgi:putative oxidoreductase
MKSGRGLAQDAGLLLGRVLLSLAFLPIGLKKAAHWDHDVAMMRALRAPEPSAAAALAVLCETVLPLLILIGFKTRLSSLLMALYLSAMTWLTFRPWLVPSAQALNVEFLNSLGLIGGFLLLASAGAGRFSVARD